MRSPTRAVKPPAVPLAHCIWAGAGWVGAVNAQRQGARLVMTTHDPGGGGRPRLIFAFGGTAPEHDSQRELDLLPGVTVIGSLGPHL